MAAYKSSGVWNFKFWNLKFWVVEMTGVEPATSCLQSRRSANWATSPNRFYILDLRFWISISSIQNPQSKIQNRVNGCGDRIWTCDLWVMSPTSYQTAPPRDKPLVVGLGRLELPTSRLSGVRSNQLSYRPSSCVAKPEVRVISPYVSKGFCLM